MREFPNETDLGNLRVKNFTAEAIYVGGQLFASAANIENTPGNSDLSAEVVNGFEALANDIDTRLTALGY